MAFSSKTRANASEPLGLLIAYAITTALAVTVYWVAIGSAHIPTSVDELTYVHITRITAASGQLLPLRAEIEQLRNLKPPLLFWQGIASTQWGEHWTRWHLRYPCVLYTLLTGFLLFLLGRKLSGRIVPGLLGFLVFLAFFSTFRYGRAFLTDPPLVFWLFLPFFVTLYWQPAAFESRLLVPLLCGAAIGVGALYKSLALAVPVIVALAWCYWRGRGYRLAAFLRRDGWKLAAMGGIAAGIFGLWFVLDPEPQAIWKEFVLKENMRKFNQGVFGYIATLLWGKENIWKLVVAYPLNAGLLAAPVATLFYLAYRNRRNLSEGEKLLWIIVLTYFFVFSLPNHRSERYLLPAMPALALLTALNWDRFNRHLLSASMVAASLLTGALIYGSLRIETAIGPAQPNHIGYWLILGITAPLLLASLLSARVLRASVLPIIFLLYLCFAAFMHPLDGPLGRYDSDTVQAGQGRQVWVPSRLNAREEDYHFLIPDADIQTYHFDLRLTAAELCAKYPLFVVRLPVNAPESFNGKILGRRFDLGSHHSLTQIAEMIRGRVCEHLLVKELLVESADALQ